MYNRRSLQLTKKLLDICIAIKLYTARRLNKSNNIYFGTYDIAILYKLYEFVIYFLNDEIKKKK